MDDNWTNRTELLIGKDAIEKLRNSKVAIYGIGGVGSFVVEGLTRAGIGNLILVDNDVIEISNLNRQIHATHKNIGKRKIDEMKKRILDINPDANVKVFMAQEIEIGEENLLDKSVTYVVDSVDTVDTKLKLIKKANELQIPILSCMGTGNRLDPTKFEITDINKTSICPLARVIRKELRKTNIKKLKVLYSKEKPIENKSKILASISFVPSVAGLIIAGEVIKDIINQ